MSEPESWYFFSPIFKAGLLFRRFDAIALEPAAHLI